MQSSKPATQQKLAQNQDGSVHTVSEETELQKAYKLVVLKKREYKAALKAYHLKKANMPELYTPKSSQNDE